MQGIRGRSKERGSNTIAWTEEIIVGSNDAAVAAGTWKWEHEAEGREAEEEQEEEEGARTTLASSFSSSPPAALFFTVVVFSAITIIIIVINATHTCHASKCAVPKYGSPPAVATNAEDGAV